MQALQLIPHLDSSPQVASQKKPLVTKRSTREPSRVLCLKFPRILSNAARLAEAYLRFSPRLHIRDDQWLFLDIASTTHLFNGEAALLEQVLKLSRELGWPNVSSAISDTACGAQALAVAHPTTICPPGEERDFLQRLSLPLLLQLEGLKGWSKPSEIEHIISFFYMLGFQRIGELSRLTVDSFEQRWGLVGQQLWQRLQCADRQVISPFLPSEPLKDYVHLDFPISLTSLLLHEITRSLQFLFARLQGRGLFAQEVRLILHCEYSNAQNKISVEPNQPSRQLELFLTLLENKLENVDFENPIRQFEVEIIAAPEKVQQFDFFEPRTSDRDRLDSLLSLIKQAGLQAGQVELMPEILPEQAWRFNSTFAAFQLKSNYRELYAKTAWRLKNATNSEPAKTKSPTKVSSSSRATTASDSELPESLAYLSEYGTAVHSAPRPTRLLDEPRALSRNDMQKIRLLQPQYPIERIQSSWWEKSTSERDYYFAVSEQGQCLWIYQDLKTETYYLHGYFD